VFSLGEEGERSRVVEVEDVLHSQGDVVLAGRHEIPAPRPVPAPERDAAAAPGAAFRQALAMAAPTQSASSGEDESAAAWMTIL